MAHSPLEAAQQAWDAYARRERAAWLSVWRSVAQGRCGELQCMVRSTSTHTYWFCTRPRGYTGAHVAHVLDVFTGKVQNTAFVWAPVLTENVPSELTPLRLPPEALPPGARATVEELQALAQILSGLE